MEGREDNTILTAMGGIGQLHINDHGGGGNSILMVMVLECPVCGVMVRCPQELWLFFRFLGIFYEGNNIVHGLFP